MKKLKFTKLNLAEMEIIKGGGIGRVVGIRVYGGTCYLDLLYEGDASPKCDVEYPAEFCEGMKLTD